MLRAFAFSMGLLFVVWTTPGLAWQADMINDVHFGADVPLLDAASGSTNLPIGFVHMPVSGGYLFFSVQVISGLPKLVATRFRPDGSLDTFWQDPAHDPYATLGSIVIALPIPDVASSGFVSARVVGDSSTDNVYLAQLNGSTSTFGATDLRITQLNAKAAIIGTDSVSYSGSFSFGFGSIEAGTANVAIGSSGTGALFALQGYGSEANVSVFMGAAGSPFNIVKTTSHVNSGFRVNYMTAQSDGTVDVVGTEGSQALYLQLSTGTSPRVEYENYFNLYCPGGSLSTASTVDAIVRAPPSYSQDDVLVSGRVDCGVAGRLQTVARVTSIRFRMSAIISAYSTTPSSDCGDPVATSYCFTSNLMAVGDAANSALATTTDGSAAHIDANPHASSIEGIEVYAAASAFPLLFASAQFGVSLEYPYLIGMSLNNSSGTTQPGIRRIAIDRVFADGAGD